MPEGELVLGDLVGGKPAELGDVVRGLGISFDDAGRPVEVERRCGGAVASVAVHPDPDQVEGLDLDPRLLLQLAPSAVERVLALVEKAAGEVPAALVRRN